MILWSAFKVCLHKCVISKPLAVTGDKFLHIYEGINVHKIIFQAYSWSIFYFGEKCLDVWRFCGWIGGDQVKKNNIRVKKGNLRISTFSMFVFSVG